ncbi:MAG: MBOAT family protein [Oscillospiraceae bacterium]|nr:MBOAT family protein [Oscillospiraceae bacterium]
MLFSSVTFLYYFLPVVLALYFILPTLNGRQDLRNSALLLASLIFYAWGEPVYVFLMLGQCVTAWAFSLLINKYRGKTPAKFALAGVFAVSLGALFFFKYTNFFISNFNMLFKTNSKLLELVMPIGISFYTFQILSYAIDVYNGRTEVQRNVLSFSTYVSLFPQLIAGPIVRYSDVEKELKSRKTTIADFSDGARRFTAGLAKKVLIANVLGEFYGQMRGGTDVLSGWLYIIAYALHIYFDFSGYSDMAIGLGRILGFKFPENFNYPYISKSVTEFWRRWHMTLSSWFRDYVYIPLGGNRKGAKRQFLNILIVWFLTGFWHGANWNFIVWGLYFAAFLLIEKLILLKLLQKMPKLINHIYLLLIVAVGWVFFDSLSTAEIGKHLSVMFGFGADGFAGTEPLYYLRSYAVPLIIALVGATPLPKKLFDLLENKKARALTFMQPAVTGILLIIITAYLVDGSFNPFIYFRF